MPLLQKAAAGLWNVNVDVQISWQGQRFRGAKRFCVLIHVCSHIMRTLTCDALILVFSYVCSHACALMYVL